MADDTVKKLLENLHLNEYIEIFEKNNITESILKILTESMIAELIKDIGPRAIFLNHWKRNFINCLDDSPVAKKKKILHDSSNVDESPGHNSVQTLKKKPGNLSKMINHQLVRSLQDILDCVEGTKIVKSFTNLGKRMSDSLRNRLTNLIISEVENDDVIFNNEIAAFFAKDIEAFFEGETRSTYYIAPVSKKNSAKKKSEPARGKLMVMWRNRQTQNKKLQKAMNIVDTVNSTTQIVEDDVNSPAVQESVEWLKVNQAPWETVVQHWRQTFKLRITRLQRNDKNISNIVSEWDLYKHVHGYKLISIDFEYLKLTNSQLNIDVWKSFWNIVKESTSFNPKDKTADELMEIITNDDSKSDSMVIASFMMLSHLLPPKGMMKLSKIKGYKPSIASCKHSMIREADTAANLSNIKHEAKKEAGALNRPLQPYIIIVASELKNIQDIYVCVDDILYKVKDALEAIDICFKVYHVFNFKYPFDSDHLWTLIQKGIYNFDTSFDNIHSFMEHVIHKVRKSATENNSSDSAVTVQLTDNIVTDRSVDNILTEELNSDSSNSN